MRKEKEKGGKERREMPKHGIPIASRL